MKRILPLLFALVALGTACTPAELRAFNAAHGTDHPLPPVVDAHDRAAMIELPVTLVTADECGTERNVIAWYGDDGRSFVYEDEAGARWIFVADSYGCGFHWLLTDDACSYDGFYGVTSDTCDDNF